MKIFSSKIRYDILSYLEVANVDHNGAGTGEASALSPFLI